MSVSNKIHKFRVAIEAVMHRANPCNAPEESLRWRIACLLFPECWCCAGLRGFSYGVILTSLIAWVVL